LADASGGDIISTFAGNPATLQIGSGQLAPFLEQLLFDLPEGAQRVFEISPEQGFGLRNPELLQWVARTTLDANSAPDSQYQIGDLVDFAAPGGGRFAGVLREIQEQGALFDFNHPLAGQALRFEVKIIGIL
jgi:FKBP-type peptidyl-prolyl cis-trans isomerase SlpA